MVRKSQGRKLSGVEHGKLLREWRFRHLLVGSHLAIYLWIEWETASVQSVRRQLLTYLCTDFVAASKLCIGFSRAINFGREGRAKRATWGLVVRCSRLKQISCETPIESSALLRPVTLGKEDWLLDTWQTVKTNNCDGSFSYRFWHLRVTVTTKPRSSLWTAD